MASGILVNIKEEVTCPICLELLTEPMSLNCGHTFCQVCITANNSESMTGQESICPVCRISYQPENLRPNRHVANIVEAFRGVKLSPKEEQKRDLCVRHGERLLIFCKEDEKIICWLCERSQEHSGHQTFLVEEIAQEYKEKLQAALVRLKAEQQIAEKLEDDLAEERTSKEDQIENELKSVHDSFQQLRGILASEEQKELQRLEKEAAEDLDDLAQAESELAQQRKLLRDLISDLEHRLQGSTVEMLQDVKDTMKRSKNFTLKKPTTLSKKQRRLFHAPDLRVHMTLDPSTDKSNTVISADRRQVKSIGMTRFPPSCMAWAQLLEQRRPQENIPQQNSESMMAKPQVVVAPVLISKLSGNAAESYPSCYSNYTKSCEDGCEDYPTLSKYVQDFLNHLTEQPGSFETEIDQFAEPLNGWVTTDVALQELVELIYQQATSIPNFSYMAARLCNYLSHHLTICSQSGKFRQLLLQRCRTEYKLRNQAAKGNEAIRKRFHMFVLFLGELYLKWEIKVKKGQVARTYLTQASFWKLLNALFSNPVDDNLICAIKLLKLTGSVLEDSWKKKKKMDMEEVIQKIENFVLDAHCSRDVKQMLLKLVDLRSNNWGRVHVTSTYRKATPENDPNYFMNEPTFYTSDGFPFTAADPDYQDKYQELLELLEREDFFPDYKENGKNLSGSGDPYLDDRDGEMDPEIEEAYEKFCLELECKQKG